MVKRHDNESASTEVVEHKSGTRLGRAFHSIGHAIGSAVEGVGTGINAVVSAPFSAMRHISDHAQGHHVRGTARPETSLTSMFTGEHATARYNDTTLKHRPSLDIMPADRAASAIEGIDKGLKKAFHFLGDDGALMRKMDRAFGNTVPGDDGTPVKSNNSNRTRYTDHEAADHITLRESRDPARRAPGGGFYPSDGNESVSPKHVHGHKSGGHKERE